ncbi:MAG: CPBP family intramembrane metalloprotease [Bacteroidetes bacterium]|nr:CPBP family intramembrane metalloprotease [Bacteroidota bacterium]MBU1373297.1 CPBP family intramembrane metalloprotease [Bacteroidota bacterium]MBU1486351.1 CPBP family intramembrane metalloprotease [Bacteroidota bacterium]MBU1759386.1 CPBP family intramembrane metalloprotease [Bacteroidota bacterium]MBU2268290.1 CPBP family intramembrane metalloprotease [Bacteroidota bacterium]
MEENTKSDKRNWTNIFKIFIPYALTVGIFQLLMLKILGLDWSKGNELTFNSFQDFWMSFATFLGTFIIIWIYVKYVDKRSFKSLGFKSKNLLKDILLGIVFGFAIIFIGYEILIYSKELLFINYNQSVSDILFSFCFFIFVAINEELLVRGYFLQNLEASLNKFWALIISSLIFSLLHIFNNDINFLSLTNLFLAGLFIGLAYSVTRNLWLSIALHFSWNFFQGTIFGFNVSGRDSFSIIQTTYNQPDIWNGGSFGFEGSVLCIILQVIGIITLYFILRKRETERAKI